jgi:hypothetical protein
MMTRSEDGIWTDVACDPLLWRPSVLAMSNFVLKSVERPWEVAINHIISKIT